MKYFVIPILLFFSTMSSWASSFEECTFQAELKFKEKDKHQVLLVKLLDEEGHYPSCKRFLGSRRIKINNIDDHKKLKTFKLKYSSYSGMGPKGPVSSNSWKIISDKTDK